jgi:type I restriction enzyme, S subunit
MNEKIDKVRIMEKVKIKKFTDVITGGTPSTSKNEFWENGNIPWLNSGELNQKIVTTSRNYITKLGLEKSSSRLMPKDTVLIALTGSTTGVVGYLTFEACANQSVTGILPSDNHNSKYLYYYLNSIRTKVLSDAYGGAQPHISQGYVKELEIPLPPIATQQKIAAILDQAEAIKQNNRTIVQKYDALTQSLFLEMFGDPVKNEKGWEMKTLKDFGTSRLGKMLDGKKIIGNNLKPYLRNSNVQWFRFELNDLLKMDFDEKDKVEFSLKVGDILMCEGGEIGRCAIWKDEIEDCYFQKAIHRIRLNDKYILPEYFVYMFKNIADNGGLDEFKSAATISHLTGEKLKKMRMPIPTIEIQNQFAERVAAIEAQKQQAQLASAKSEALFQSLLQQAFKGELN